MMKHDIDVQAGIHDSLSNSVSEMYNINYLGTSFVAMQGASPSKLVEKLELNHGVGDARHLA